MNSNNEQNKAAQTKLSNVSVVMKSEPVLFGRLNLQCSDHLTSQTRQHHLWYRDQRVDNGPR